MRISFASARRRGISREVHGPIASFIILSQAAVQLTDLDYNEIVYYFM